MNKKVLRAFSLLIAVCAVVFLFADYSMAAKSVPAPYVPTGFPQVVVVSGTDFEMGRQYGQQAAPAIVHNLALMKSKLYDKYGADTVTADMKVWDFYTRIYDPGLVDWLEGIKAGCKTKGYNISYLDLVILMVYPSENWARPASRPYPPETKVKLKTASGSLQEEFHACNSFAATGDMTKDGKAVHGITQMVSAEAMDTVILLAFPTNGPSWVSVPYSGRVNGNSGMNSEGFAWTLTAISQWGPTVDEQDSFWGLITEVYFHYFAGVTKTPAEAVAYLSNTPRAGVTGGITMSDKNGNIETFECNSTHSTLRYPGQLGETGNFLVMTNHLADPAGEAWSPWNPPWAGPTSNSAQRYNSVFDALDAVAGQGKVDFKFAKKLFEDNYSPGSSINQSIFQPTSLTAYLQTGTPTGNGLPPYATGEYVKIRLTTDPKTVTYNAGNDASTFYWAARTAFQNAINAEASWLTTDVYNDVQAMLDEAYTAYTLGMDRASWADLQKRQSPALWAEALTYYAKAQLYAQMASTALLRAQ